MADRAKHEARVVWGFFRAFVKWVVIASVTGALGGLVGALFHVAVSEATACRGTYPWLLWLLPAAGLLIAGAYSLTGMEHKNTNAIIDSVHLGERVPLLLVPVIFVSTALTHLCGGSAGREGAALQIGGGIGGAIGRLFMLDEKDMRLAVLCGMSAVFSALFGTPLTATLFALEVISVGVLYYSGLVPCIVASVVAFFITRLMGLEPTRFAIALEPLTAGLLLRVAVLAMACAIISVVFCVVMHGTERLAGRCIRNVYLRAAVGGALVVGLTLLMGTTDYNGAGMPVITAALEDGTCRPAAFFWKLVFTAISLGFGFRGGEVVPTFFIGAAFGCVVGPLLGIPAGFAAAIGLISVFCGAVNCPVASIVLSIELFGSTELIYFAVACGISYMLSGYFGLYSSQKIVYSKTRPEFINIQAK